ncbi:heavy-metal-associated domain-containing protein [Amnibacterium endophyticum]|uniref:Heavy-metal-associated domain-containing protein n=1 Tax=Amnibacterium endophyticum TaxID=2109337 RepID=A0ABW4LJB4_9MICO
MISEYAVSGMTCEHCERRVQTEVGALEGVTEVTADAASGTVRVVSAGPVDADALAEAIDEAGYELAHR